MLYKRRTYLALALAVLLCCGMLFSLLASCEALVTLDNSGELIVEDLRIGAGEPVATGDSIVQVGVNYVGKLTDSTVFDATRGQPVQLLLGFQRVIEGIDKGMRGMRVGGRRRITIPPRMGYGAMRQGNIPPNATLVFEVDLLNLQRFIIEDQQLGTGDSARVNSTVSVRYTGRLTNGRIFDQSGDMPFRFTIGRGQVIQGWEQGIFGMRVGGKRRLTIPSELGYGARGQGVIPPNATLIFDVELLSAQ